MQQQEHFPLIMPATHSAKDSAQIQPLPQVQPGFKEESAENDLSDHAQLHQVRNSVLQGANQAEKSMKSKVSTRKLKGPAGTDSHNNAKLSQIIKKKKELDEEIARLKYEEETQKRAINKGFNRNMRSQITQEQKIAIKKALEERRKFQMVASMKAKQLEQQIRQKQKSEEKRMQQKLQSLRSQKRKQALNHLQVMKLKQMERTKKIKQANKKFQEAKLKTFLHEKMQEKWESQIAQRQQNNKQILQAIRNKKHFSVQELKKHQQEFKQFIKKDEQQRKKNFTLKIMQKKEIEKQTLQKYQPSAFLKTVFEQQQSKKRQQQSKTLQLFANISKKSLFSETIRQANKDSIMKKQTLSPIKQVNDKVQNESTNNKSEKARSLSQVQLFKLGNNYMRQIHSSLSHVDIDMPKDRKKEDKKSIKYDDYLKDLREQRAKLQSNPQVQQIRELKSLMKKQISMDEKWHKAKLITSRLEQRANLDTETLLKSISTKIQMINSLRAN